MSDTSIAWLFVSSTKSCVVNDPAPRYFTRCEPWGFSSKLSVLEGVDGGSWESYKVSLIYISSYSFVAKGAYEGYIGIGHGVDALACSGCNGETSLGRRNITCLKRLGGQ